MPKIGAVLAESPGKLSIEARRMKHPGSASDAPGVPNQHNFVEELIIRAFVDGIGRRDELAVVNMVRECEVIMIDGKSRLQRRYPARTGAQSKIEGFAIVCGPEALRRLR